MPSFTVHAWILQPPNEPHCNLSAPSRCPKSCSAPQHTRIMVSPVEGEANMYRADQDNLITCGHALSRASLLKVRATRHLNARSICTLWLLASVASCICAPRFFLESRHAKYLSLSTGVLPKAVPCTSVKTCKHALRRHLECFVNCVHYLHHFHASAPACRLSETLTHCTQHSAAWEPARRVLQATSTIAGRNTPVQHDTHKQTGRRAP